MAPNFKNKCYAVSMLFRSLRDGEILPDSLWEESIVLIDAVDEHEASEIAAQRAAKKRLSYRTVDGTLLTWEFFRVAQVAEVGEELTDGCEVFSRHLRAVEARSLLTPFDD